MAQFHKDQNIVDFQRFIEEVYALPDDRLYSIWDLLTHVQRFAMRALKGIRKGNAEKLRVNLIISFSWLMAIANRLHVSLEEEMWKRFPALCSYCGGKPCECKTVKPSVREKITIDHKLRPRTLSETQALFQEIYPSSSRTLPDAGVHFAEEVGEVSEAIHNFLGQHHQKQFDEIKLEMADFVSCFFGIANSAEIDVAEELAAMFQNGCHVCHKTPCVCSFSEVVQIKT